MSLSPNTIRPASGSTRTPKRLGRGNGSQKGTMSGRGGKGQKARSGGKRGRRKLAFKKILQKVPKLRGFRSIVNKRETVTFHRIASVFQKNDVVTPWTLVKKGLVNNPKNGVKIVATGELNMPLVFRDCFVSKTAIAQIEKAGGSVKL